MNEVDSIRLEEFRQLKKGIRWIFDKSTIDCNPTLRKSWLCFPLGCE